MIKFKCENCGKEITDYCGEHCDSDDYGRITNYTCPHCGKTINVKED